MLSVLPIDQPCIQEVTYGSTDGLSPIMLRAQLSFLVEEKYKCKVVTSSGLDSDLGMACIQVFVYDLLLC